MPPAAKVKVMPLPVKKTAVSEEVTIAWAKGAASQKAATAMIAHRTDLLLVPCIVIERLGWFSFLDGGNLT